MSFRRREEAGELRIFLTQELNWVLLHCRRILYQLSYQGSPKCEVKVKVAQSCPTLCDSMDYTVHGILQARILEGVAFTFSGESSQPRDSTSPVLQVDSLPAEPQGKSKNTGVGSLCPTQESN